jgi:hypothetical protein
MNEAKKEAALLPVRLERHVRLRWVDRPISPGWYWFNDGDHLQICKVHQVNIDCWDEVPHHKNTFWAGPIPEPEQHNV